MANRAKIAEAQRLYRKRSPRKKISDPAVRREINRKREERRKRNGTDRRAYFRARNVRLAEEIREKRRGWRQRDREKTRAYQSRPQIKVALRLRQRLWKLLGNRKSRKMVGLLGCSVTELARHLEILFEPGMTWENRGRVWHVDHVLPLSSFDLADPAQRAKACHFTNLQPLFAKDNLSKGSRVRREAMSHGAVGIDELAFHLEQWRA